MAKHQEHENKKILERLLEEIYYLWKKGGDDWKFYNADYQRLELINNLYLFVDSHYPKDSSESFPEKFYFGLGKDPSSLAIKIKEEMDLSLKRMRKLLREIKKKTKPHRDEDESKKRLEKEKERAEEKSKQEVLALIDKL